jgi:hypothetical protein
MQKAKTKSMTRSFTRFMSRKVGNNLNKQTYQDDRETSGYIFIDLKDGYVFGDGYSTTADCLNVKSAIAAMRTVKAI